jgi:hypothetical protein
LIIKTSKKKNIIAPAVEKSEQKGEPLISVSIIISETHIREHKKHPITKIFKIIYFLKNLFIS